MKRKSTERGSQNKQASPIACSPRPNGSTQREPVTQADIPLATTRRSSVSTLGPARTPTARRNRWGERSPTRSASTTCTAMCGSGWRTATKKATAARRRTGLLSYPKIAVAGLFAAAPGAAIQTSSARPPGAGSSPSSGLAMSGFVSGGRLHRESLPLYLMRSRSIAPGLMRGVATRCPHTF
jgi:hypothetical protein